MSKEKTKKPFYKKWWVWTLVVLVGLAIIGSGGESEDAPQTSASVSEENKTANTSVSEAKTEEVEEVEETIAGIGETVRVGDVEFTVNDITTATNVGGEWGENSQGTYLLINTSVTNVGNEAITTDSSFFKLKVGDKTYEADSTAGIYANEDADFFLVQVNPDLTATGYVVFDVSDSVLNSPELTLQVQTGFWGTETGLIDLTK